MNVYDHELVINADSYLLKNDDLVPSGESVQLILLYRDNLLTPSTPAVQNCCCSKGPWLSPERQSAQMSKIKNDGLDRYGKV